jgi:glucokinase
MILAGDIGGTKSTFMLFAAEDASLRAIYRFTAPTNSSPSMGHLLDSFLQRIDNEGFSQTHIAAAGFGVAGTVVEGGVVTNNLPWAFERNSVADALKLDISRTVLINDLVATASSLAHLKDTDLLPLNHGSAQRLAPKALIAAGTGLGEAILFWNGQRYQISPSEAGLTDFAPRNDHELLLLQSLRQRMPRVCTEEVVSGRGFRAIHQIIFPGVHHAFFDQPGEDTAACVTQLALSKSCDACAGTLQIWIEAYGAEAGNMALRVLPFGGVYIAGGIALKILSKLKDGSFVRAFSDKLKLSTQLAKIPIFVVLDGDAPVLGAAYEALGLADEHRMNDLPRH